MAGNNYPFAGVMKFATQISPQLNFYRLPKTSRNDEFNFNEWMADKDKLARSTLEKFDKRFGLPEDFKLTPPLFDDAEKWTPIS